MLLAEETLLLIDSRLFISKTIISLNIIENSIHAIQIVCSLWGKLQLDATWTDHNVSFTTTNRSIIYPCTDTLPKTIDVFQWLHLHYSVEYKIKICNVLYREIASMCKPILLSLLVSITHTTSSKGKLSRCLQALVSFFFPQNHFQGLHSYSRADENMIAFHDFSSAAG